MYNYQGVHISGRRFERYCEVLKLDSSILANEKRIIDVGSGFSNFTDVIASKGVDSIAVDAGYSDIEKMAKKYINQPVPDTLVDMKDKFKWAVNGCSTYGEAKNKIGEFRIKRFNEFKKIFENNRERYSPQDCFELSFPDKSFDLAVCVELIGNRAYFSERRTTQGIKEMLRVSKEVRIYSYLLNGNTRGLEEDINCEEINRHGENLLVIR